MAPRRSRPGDACRAEEVRRTAFTDFLSPFDSDLQGLIKKSADSPRGSFYGDPAGRCCGREEYEVPELDKVRGKLLFRLPPRPELPFGFMGIEKSYQLKKDSLTVRYRLINHGGETERFCFIPRIDLAFPGEGDSYQRISGFRSGAREPVPLKPAERAEELSEVGDIEFRDIKNEVTLALHSGRAFDLWLYSLRIPCCANDQIVDWYQSTCIMPVNRIVLNPGGFWETDYTLRISQK
jgi:hypothetical protein